MFATSTIKKEASDNYIFFTLFFLLLSLDLTPTLSCIGSGHPVPSLVFSYFHFLLLFMPSLSLLCSTPTLYAPSTSPPSFLFCFTDKASPILLSPTLSSCVALPGGPWPCTCASCFFWTGLLFSSGWNSPGPLPGLTPALNFYSAWGWYFTFWPRYLTARRTGHSMT